MLHLFINKAKCESLPKVYQAAVKAAAHVANTHMMAKYDALNAAALRRLVSAGTRLRPFTEAVLDATFKTANELYAEISVKTADFKKVYEAMKVNRADNYLWFQLSENTFDTYMMVQQRKKLL